MEAAVLMAIGLVHGGKPGDYHDFVGILVLLVINSTISFIEENNAGNAAAALMARLAPKAKGDIVSIKLGDIVPVDAHFLEGDPLKIDQLTRSNGFHLKGGVGCSIKCRYEDVRMDLVEKK
ncbi:hypothetical protein RJ639_019160, partial [Escallonia herrerae]